MNEKKISTSPRTAQVHRMYRAGDYLSLTINPPPSMQYLTDGSLRRSKKLGSPAYFPDRKRKFVDTWQEWFDSELKPYADYIFYLECSNYGLLHWHGEIKVKKPAEFANALAYLKYELDIKGVDLDTIDDQSLWLEYISKDYEINKCKLTPMTLKKKKPRGITDYISSSTSDSSLSSDDS